MRSAGNRQKNSCQRAHGGLVIKGEDEKGRLRYTWKDVEVLVTPLEKREPLPENVGFTAQKRVSRPPDLCFG